MHAQIFLFSGKLFQPTLFKKSFRFFQKIIQHIPKWTFIKRNKINLPTFPFYVKVEELQQINCCVLLFLFILLFLISRHWKRFSSFLESALFFVAHSSLSLSLSSLARKHIWDIYFSSHFASTPKNGANEAFTFPFSLSCSSPCFFSFFIREGFNIFEVSIEASWEVDTRAQFVPKRIR